jgi:leucine dehydrogenase
MTYKAACAGLDMGGAKSVILLDSPRAPFTEAQARAMGRFVNSFNGDYIAAEDVGVNEQFVDWMATETNHVMGGTGEGQGGDPSPHTALGVFRGMQACLRHLGMDQFTGLTVALQGVGSVGAHLARLLHEHGAELVVADIHESAVQEMVEQWGARTVGTDEIIATECDILAPCALGAVIGQSNIDSIKARIICGAANNQLVDHDHDAAALQDRGILYGPDFIVNAGGLIHLAGLYLGLTPEELLAKIDDIESTTLNVFQLASEHGSTAHAAIALAEARIAGGRSREETHAG